MTKASDDKDSQDSALTNSSSVTRTLDRLKGRIDEQDALIRELTLIQEILSMMCEVSLYQVSIFEAIRDEQDEVVSFAIQRLNFEDGRIRITAESTTSTDNTNPNIIAQFQQNQEVNSSEYEFCIDDGNDKQRWFLNKLKVFKRTPAGIPHQVLIITQDISEKKSKELLSLEKQQLITSVTDASPDILFILNLPGLEITYANRAVNDIFHYTEEEILKMGGTFMEDATHPEDKEKIFDYFRTLSKDKDFPLKELHYRMKDAFGEWHHIRCRHSIFKTDKNGLPRQLIGVKQDITEFKKVQEKRILTRVQRQKDISRAILQAQEEERKRIAEALHNSLGQVLYVVKLKLDILEPDTSSPLKKNEEIKASISELIDNAIRETRTISFELMPATLEDFGLETALKDILRTKLDKSEIRYKVFISGLKTRLPPDIEIAVFRIVQELINNVVKHAKATIAEVRVNRGADYVIIKISDNGIGFNLKKKIQEKGFGLRSIVSRVKFLNGTISFDPAVGTGSVITVDIPL